MALKFNDLKFKTRLPKIPKSMELLEVRAASFEERLWSIDTLGRRLELGKLSSAEVPHGYIFASKRGEVEFFRASGSVWASNTAEEAKFEHEERRWKGVTESGRGAKRSFKLDRDTAASLSKSSQEFLKQIGLQREEAEKPSIQLDQWAHIDPKGKEIKRGAGPATVKFGYKIEGFPAIGPGAKTLVFAEPVDGRPWISGVFHAWRDIVGSRRLRMPSIEDSLRIGLLHDPELVAYGKQKCRISITRIDFGYIGLPAFVEQRYMFPAFEVEGKVEHAEDKRKSFAFGRYFHAASPKQYAKTDAVAHYLMEAL